MATRAQILAYVEQSEYLRERARMEAEQLFEDVDIEAVVNDPHGEAQKLVDALFAALVVLMLDAFRLADSHSSELGLDDLADGEAETIVQEALSDAHAEAEAAVYARMQATQDRVQAMRDEGLDNDVITANMNSDAGRAALLVGLLGVLQSAASNLIARVERDVNAAAIAATEASATQPVTYRWRTVGDGRECSDQFENSCDPRDGLVATLDEWQAAGPPGASNLLCTIYSKTGVSKCRCRLINSKQPDTEPGKVDVSEAIDAGKERARASAKG